MGLFKRQQPESVEIYGRELHCQICGHDKFLKREAQLNTALASFLDLDWTNKSAVCVVCGQCGYIHWFLPQ
jgi:predicted nucleic-acid-binding Zn-ribbon protein